MMKFLRKLIDIDSAISLHDYIKKEDGWDWLREQQILFKNYTLQHPISRIIAIQKARSMEDYMYKFEFWFYDEVTEVYLRDNFTVKDYGNIDRIKDQIDLIAKDILRRANSLRKEFAERPLLLEEIMANLKNEDRTINQFFELIADLKAEQEEELEEEAISINTAFKNLNNLLKPINFNKTMRELTC
jgi:hypothetical protein